MLTVVTGELRREIISLKVDAGTSLDRASCGATTNPHPEFSAVGQFEPEFLECVVANQRPRSLVILS